MCWTPLLPIGFKNILFYIITGDLKIINNTSLREGFAKGPKSIKYLWIPSRVMPDNGQSVKRRT